MRAGYDPYESADPNKRRIAPEDEGHDAESVYQPAKPVDSESAGIRAPSTEPPVVGPTPPSTPPPPAPSEPPPVPITPSAGGDHNGVYNGLNREQYRDLWQGSGISDIAGLKAWIAQHGGTLLSDNGTVQTPYGEQLDMLEAARTGKGRPAWGGIGAPGAGGAPGAAGALGAGGVPGAAGSAQGGAGANPFQDQIRQIILGQLRDLSKPYDPNADPTYNTAMGAARSESQRAREQQQKAIAERLAAQGYSVAGGGGALQNEMEAAFDAQSGQLSSLAGQMVQRTLADRKSQLTTMLNMAMQSGDAEAARAVQLQIAAIDAELRRMGLSQQADQFGQSLANQRDQFGQTMNEQRYQFDKLLPTYYT